MAQFTLLGRYAFFEQLLITLAFHIARHAFAVLNARLVVLLVARVLVIRQKEWRNTTYRTEVIGRPNHCLVEFAHRTFDCRLASLKTHINVGPVEE